MYCSSCGTDLKPGLSFCNRCGTALSAKSPGPVKPPEASPESLVWAIVAVSVGGLAILIGLLAVMKEANLGVGLIVAFMLLSFLLLIGANSVFIWLILRSKIGSREGHDRTQPKALAPTELAAPQERLFPESRLSVTEHTTHTLEPQNNERKTEEML